jgi:hypothetical protein
MRALGFEYPAGTPAFDLAGLVGVRELPRVRTRPALPTGVPVVQVPRSASLYDFMRERSSPTVFLLEETVGGEPYWSRPDNVGRQRPPYEFWLVGAGAKGTRIRPQPDGSGVFLRANHTAAMHIWGLGLEGWHPDFTQNAPIEVWGSVQGHTDLQDFESHVLSNHAVELAVDGRWLGGESSSPETTLGGGGGRHLVEDVRMTDTQRGVGGHGGWKTSWSAGTARRAVMTNGPIWNDVIWGTEDDLVYEDVACLDSPVFGFHAEYQAQGEHPQLIVNGYVRQPGKDTALPWPGTQGDQRNQRAGLLAHQGRQRSVRSLVEIVDGDGSGIAIWEAPNEARYRPGVTTAAGSSWTETVVVARETGPGKPTPFLVDLPAPGSFDYTLERPVFVVPSRLAGAEMFRVGGQRINFAAFAGLFPSAELVVYPAVA